MMKLIRDVTPGDAAKIILAAFTLLSVVYFAGVQSHRLDIVEANQQRVLMRIDELMRSDYEIKIEIGKLQEHVMKKETSYSLMSGEERR